MTTTAQELKSSLKEFCCTTKYHYNPLYPAMKYTDGVQFFALNAGNGAYWFLDILGTEVLEKALSDFNLITLEVRDDPSWEITVRPDSGVDSFYSKDGSFTDCPVGEWKFYLIQNILLLPSEY